MLILADENVTSIVIDTLRRYGHDVQSIRESTRSMIDEDVISVAYAQGRILLTEDADFGELTIRRRFPVRGVVPTQLGRLSLEAEATRTAAVLAKHSNEIDGMLMVIEPSRVRVRPLPRQS